MSSQDAEYVVCDKCPGVPRHTSHSINVTPARPADYVVPPHRFVQEPRVTAHPFCGFVKWTGGLCAEGPSHPLHDRFCERCRCVVSGAHTEHSDGPPS